MSLPEPLQNLGNCPICGSAAVNSIAYGEPLSDYNETWPSNVQVGGCVIRDANRACTNCGTEWHDPSAAF
ncbi:hypothetical protein [Flexivirga lutea]